MLLLYDTLIWADNIKEQSSRGNLTPPEAARLCCVIVTGVSTDNHDNHGYIDLALSPVQIIDRIYNSGEYVILYLYCTCDI